jgi:hypothetical protein
MRYDNYCKYYILFTLLPVSQAYTEILYLLQVLHLLWVVLLCCQYLKLYIEVLYLLSIYYLLYIPSCGLYNATFNASICAIKRYIYWNAASWIFNAALCISGYTLGSHSYWKILNVLCFILQRQMIGWIINENVFRENIKSSYMYFRDKWIVFVLVVENIVLLSHKLLFHFATTE